MAKAGRRARARAAASMRAAAISRSRNALRAVQQQQAPPSEQSRLEKLPGDILGVVVGFMGFHSFSAAVAVSKTLSQAPDAATRARHRLTLAAMPSLPSGPRNLRDRRLATEYLSLAPPTDEGSQSRTIICSENYRYDKHESLMAVFRRTNSRCVLRTVCERGSTFPFIVEINKCRGEVLVYEHPSADENGKALPFDYENGTQKFQWVMDRCNLDEMKVLETYEAAGVFIGSSYLGRTPSNAPSFEGSILVQLSATNHTDPRYGYVFIGDDCRYFETPEPITRYFHHVSDMFHSNVVALTSTYALFPEKCWSSGKLTIPYAPRTAFADSYGRSYASMEESAGEGVWEICQECPHENFPMPHLSLPVTLHRFSPSYYMEKSLFDWQRTFAKEAGISDPRNFPLDEVRETLDWHWAKTCRKEGYGR